MALLARTVNTRYLLISKTMDSDQIKPKNRSTVE